jgi:hypothetical protein
MSMNGKKEIRKKKNSNGLNITRRIFPSKVISRDGQHYIGDYIVTVDDSNIPFNYRDNVDYYLNGLFDYIRDASELNKSNKIKMENYFKNFRNDVGTLLPLPIPINKMDKLQGGKKTRRRRRHLKKHGKTSKSKK